MMSANKITKLQTLLNNIEKQKQETNENENGERKKIEYLPFFNPNKMFTGRSEVIVRVLPNDEDFYYAYKKHMISMGVGNFKQFICMNSEKEDGIRFGDKCPLCDFLEDNRDIDKKIAWQMMAKDVYCMFVYNPYAKQIQRYECQSRAMGDITKCVVDMINEDNTFDPNAEGFDVVFVMDGKYPKCVQILKPKTPITDVLQEATNVDVALNEDKTNIKSFMAEIMPYSKSTTEKYINTTAQTVVAGMCPGYSIDKYLFEIQPYTPNSNNNNMANDGYSNVDFDDIDTTPTTEDDLNQMFPIADETETKTVEVKEEVKTETKEEQTTGSTEINDIKAFLAARSKKG